ncbi:hypothetical protein U1707_12080 [Sphingomonas sp. PB2P12]|uniref:hypothetical protein n=1 Tax=Sphingomonas sandaracina TaxID=3096157 RepID=UPI002FCA70FA
MAGLTASLTLLATSADAQASPLDDTVPLWPSNIPGDHRARIVRKAHDPANPDQFLFNLAQPMLVMKRPARANGAAVLIISGGGYGFLSYYNEGVDEGTRLSARGVTLVPVANSIALDTAPFAAKRPAALHVSDESDHGFGIRPPKSATTSAWPDIFYAYGVRKGVFA